MAKVARYYTNKLINDMEQDILDAEAVVMMCLNYMSEHEVEDMLRVNDCLGDEDEEDEELEEESDEETG